MVLYDCESTSADIYKDHIMEIAAIVHLPVSMKRLDFRAPLIFQSLVSTSRRILPIGKYNLIFAIFYSIFYMHSGHCYRNTLSFVLLVIIQQLECQKVTQNYCIGLSSLVVTSCSDTNNWSIE